MESYLLIPVVVVVVWLLYKLVALLRADADLTLLSKSLNSSYFQGRVVWVTGASSGIGEELCYQLSRLGAKLILTSRSEDKLKIVRKGLSKPNDAHILPVDLSDPVATRAATEKALAFFGRIDILFNNAGFSSDGELIKTEEPVFRKLLEVDLLAPWILSHDTLPGMLANDFGHIVNISSVMGKFGMFQRTTYAAAKFGLIGMMDSLRYELIDEKVHVTNVCPGPVKTGLAVNSLIPEGCSPSISSEWIEHGMKVQRCTELTLIAVSNQLAEVWIAKQPVLATTYIAQYLPSLYTILENLFTRYELRNMKKAS